MLSSVLRHIWLRAEPHLLYHGWSRNQTSETPSLFSRFKLTINKIKIVISPGLSKDVNIFHVNLCNFLNLLAEQAEKYVVKFRYLVPGLVKKGSNDEKMTSCSDTFLMVFRLSIHFVDITFSRFLSFSTSLFSTFWVSFLHIFSRSTLTLVCVKYAKLVALF